MRDKILQEPVNQRINFMIDHFEGGNKSAFGRRVDMKSGVVGDLVGGRLNKPSYDAIVKILLAYPSISADWLLLGRGEMIRGEYLVESLESSQSKEFSDLMDEEMSRNLLRYAMDKAGGFDSFMEKFFESMKPGLSNKIKQHYTQLENFQHENAVYRVEEGSGLSTLPYNGLLTNRLSISIEEAITLLKNHKIKYLSVDGTDKIDRLLIPEKAVREFLGEA